MAKSFFQLPILAIYYNHHKSVFERQYLNSYLIINKLILKVYLSSAVAVQIGKMHSITGRKGTPTPRNRQGISHEHTRHHRNFRHHRNYGCVRFPGVTKASPRATISRHISEHTLEKGSLYFYRQKFL